MVIATAAIIQKKGRYLIAKRKMGGVVGGKWEFPGGKVENCESPEECLKRELEEELGIKAYVGRFFAENVHRYKTGSLRLLAFHVSHFEGEIDLREHTEIRWVLPHELAKFAFVGNDKPLIRKISLE